jgi:hypothetical protein
MYSLVGHLLTKLFFTVLLSIFKMISSNYDNILLIYVREY